MLVGIETPGLRVKTAVTLGYGQNISGGKIYHYHLKKECLNMLDMP